MALFFPTTPDEIQSNSPDNYIRHCNVKISNRFDPELKLIKSKPLIKKKLKGLLSKLKRFEVLAVLFLDYKKKNDSQTFYSCTKLTASDFSIDKVFKSMHQSIMTKTKSYVCRDCIVLDTIIKHSIKIFERWYKEKK